MRRVYQWLIEQASFFRGAAVGQDATSIVRTETTIRREGITLLVGNVDICPLCGGKLAPEQSEQARLRLLKGSISQKTGPVDSQPP